MRCENALDLLEGGSPRQDSDERRRAERHVAECAECSAARYARAVLSATAEHPVPEPSARAVERALRAATESSAPRRERRVGFVSGAAVGAAAAAALVYAAVSLWPAAVSQTSPGLATPSVELALAEVGDVSIAVYSEQPLADAEIQILLSGEIGIAGFDGQRELRWLTPLDRGVNELSLPILALGETGGQIMVAVRGGGQTRSFLVDVKTLTREGGSVDAATRDGSI